MSMMESYDEELKFISELCDSELVASLKGHLGIPGQCHLGPLSHSNVLVPASSDHKYRDLYDNEYSLIHLDVSFEDINKCLLFQFFGKVVKTGPFIVECLFAISILLFFFLSYSIINLTESSNVVHACISVHAMGIFGAYMLHLPPS